jgi:hypothetical protein
MRRSTIVLAAGIIAVNVVPLPAYAQSADDLYMTSTDAKKLQWMDKGMDAVRSRLKDPRSAEFKKVYFRRGSDGIPMTCGQVNSKNGFGGMTGFQHFISAGREDLTFLEEDVDGFAQLWSRFCA